MTDTDDSTMAASEAAGTEFKQVGPKKKSKRLKTTLKPWIPVKQANTYMTQAYFPMPCANTKFNLIACMHLLFKEMLTYDYGHHYVWWETNPASAQYCPNVREGIQKNSSQLRMTCTRSENHCTWLLAATSWVTEQCTISNLTQPKWWSLLTGLKKNKSSSNPISLESQKQQQLATLLTFTQNWQTAPSWNLFSSAYSKM